MFLRKKFLLVYLIASFYSFAISSAIASDTCATTVFSRGDTISNNLNVEIRSSHKDISIIDQGPKGILIENRLQKSFTYHASGRLTRKNELFLNFQLRSASDPQKRRSSISGKDAFDYIVNHFGNNIHSIIGYWMAKSDNLILYKEALSKGYSPEEAALMTWTGQQAKHHGFSVARIVESKPENSFVEVRFYRP